MRKPEELILCNIRAFHEDGDLEEDRHHLDAKACVLYSDTIRFDYLLVNAVYFLRRKWYNPEVLSDCVIVFCDQEISLFFGKCRIVFHKFCV